MSGAAPVTRILLVRHGHTGGNEPGGEVRMSGWADLPLSPRGVAETEALARRLAGEPRADALYASSLDRALATARRLAPYAAGPIEPLAALCEIDCSEVDGLPVAKVQAR